MSDLAVYGRTIGQIQQDRKVTLDNIEQQFYNVHTKRGHLFLRSKSGQAAPCRCQNQKAVLRAWRVSCAKNERREMILTHLS